MDLQDLEDLIPEMSAAEWRRFLIVAAQYRCIACGEHDGCGCSDAVDAAKELVTCRALQVGL